MRHKIRTTKELKPGMVIAIRPGFLIRTSTPAVDNTAVFRQVAEVRQMTPYAERFIVFTDGSVARVGNAWEFQVTRSKARRNDAIRRAALIPAHALAGALSLLGGYTRTAVAS